MFKFQGKFAELGEVLYSAKKSAPGARKFNKVNPLFRRLLSFIAFFVSAQRVPEPDPLPGISFNTRPDSVLEIIG